MRLEKDSLGELEVPDEAYYGVQTVRCSGNYKIGNHTYNEFPEVRLKRPAPSPTAKSVL